MHRDPGDGFVSGWAGYALERAYLAGLRWNEARVLRRGPVRVDFPVVSIGNLAVGGTGKTPCAIWTARTLLDGGIRVAIVARPVGGPVPGAEGDELALLAERVPRAQVVAARNKSRGALAAAAALRTATPEVGAEAAQATIVVDDGFSHRGLARDLDVVLVDAARPIGNGHLLPRGPLREPPSALARADVVIATRSDRIDPARLDETLSALARLAPRAVIAAAWLAPTGLASGTDAPQAGQRVVCLSGLARHGELARSARALGLSVVLDLCYPDHHRFSAAEWRAAEQAAAGTDGGLVVSAKDAMRLTPERRARVRVLEVEWRFARGEAETAERLFGAARMERT
jgi:tetraacyldisaccharide 4'-kinase